MQLRTTLQDAWANQVEDDGHAVDVGFKFGRGSASVLAYYAVVSQVFAAVEQNGEVSDGLARELQTAYAKIQDVFPRQAP